MTPKDRPADNSLQYHREELAIALSADDKRRVLPNLPDRFDSILDIGCGAGQTLVACHLPEHVRAWGIDVDLAALMLGRQLAPRIQFALASGEQLPFRDGMFDVIISRVALPYMHLPHALDEVQRVLAPGGHVWLTLHPVDMPVKRLARSLSGGKFRDVAYLCYVLMNGVLFQCAGRQFRFPANRQRCESFQTVAGMARALRARGFHSITSSTEPFFLMTATKRICPDA